MGFMVRQAATVAKLQDEHVLEALAASVPAQTVRQVVDDLGIGRKRCRKLPAELTLLLAVAMHLFPREALDRVLWKLLQGLRFIWPEPALQPATKSAICQARYQVGARPLAALYHRIRRPLATPQTPGAFQFGLRLVALDGTLEDVPDSPANRRSFGGPENQHGLACFPQVRGVYLVECGTHAVIDAGFWPYTVGERTGGRRLLRSVGAGMLLLWDRGFHSADLLAATTARGAHVLGRVPSFVRLPVHTRLADGSYLCWLSSGKDWQRRRQPRQLVRVVEYTLTDPNRPGAGQRHRLLTTLLDATLAPALALVCTYHERWEIELVIDEIDTHQRLGQRPLRSQKPVGILQELYGLLIAHFAIRALMVEAAASMQQDPRRLSFVHAVQIVCDALAEFQMVTPSQRPALYQRLLRDLRSFHLPERADRLHPRVLKRTRAKHPPKHLHHRHWPQPTMPFPQAVAILI